MTRHEKIDRKEHVATQGSMAIERGVFDAGTFVVNQPASRDLHARIANRSRTLRVLVLDPSTHHPIAGAIVHLRTACADAKLIVTRITDGLGTADFTLPWPEEASEVFVELAKPWLERRAIAFEASRQFNAAVFQGRQRRCHE